MPDLDLRGLERSAFSGDLGAGVRLLRERLRRRLIERRRVKMAAFLLDETALGALGLVEAGDGIGLPRGSRVFYAPGETVGDSGLVIANDFREWANSLEEIGAQSETVRCRAKCFSGVSYSNGRGYHCLGCWGTGKITNPVPDRLFLVSCAIAAARHAGPEWKKQHQLDIHGLLNPPVLDWSCCLRPGRTIDAAEAYRDCPCEELRDLWRVAFGLQTGPHNAWVPFHSVGADRLREIQAAAQIEKPEAIRTAIERDVAPWLLA